MLVIPPVIDFCSEAFKTSPMFEMFFNININFKVDINLWIKSKVNFRKTVINVRLLRIFKKKPHQFGEVYELLCIL